MLEFNPEDFKIPVVPGINDVPIPPNFQNNGLGCNGSYYISRFNSLVEYVTKYWERSWIYDFTMSLGEAERNVIVGKRLIDSPQAINFSYAISNTPDESITARLYSGTNINSLQLISENIAPEASYSYTPSSYTSAPNVYTTPTTLFWQIQGEINNMFPLKSDIISTSWSLPVIIGKSEASSDVSNVDPEFTTLHTAVELGLYVDIELVESDQYLYIFSPTRLNGILLDNILVLTVETQQPASIYLESSNTTVEYPYWVYRTTTQGFGGVRVSLAKY